MVRPRLSVAAIALVLAGLVIAATVFGLLRSDPGPNFDGPLRGGDVRTGSGFVQDAGEAVSLAGIDLVNSGTEPVVLEGIRMVESDGIRMVGALAGQRTTLGVVEAAPGFPPRQPDELPASDLPLPDLAPLEGYVVPPQPGVPAGDREPTQLFIGLVSPLPRGRVTLQSFVLDYRVGDERYGLLARYAVAICTPRAEYVDIKPCGAFLPGDE